MDIKQLVEGDAPQEPESDQDEIKPIDRLKGSQRQAAETEAARAGAAREEIGQALGYEGRRLHPWSWGRRRLWTQIKGLGSFGELDHHREGALVVYLCLHDTDHLNSLAYLTKAIPEQRDATLKLIAARQIITCPLMLRIDQWIDEQLSDQSLEASRKQEFVSLSSIIFERYNAAQMISEDYDDDSEEEDSPGKPDQDLNGLTKLPSESSASDPIEKSNGESESTPLS